MSRRAFTLVELAVVLTVLGLVVGGSFKVIKSMRERNSISESKDAVEAAIDAVTGDAMEWDSLISVPDFNQNLSPLKGIKLSSGILKMPIHYLPDNTLIVSPICSKTSTNLNIIDNSVSPARIIQNVAFVIAHESSNNNMQTALDTTSTPNTVSIYGAATAADDNTAYPNINRPTDEYDDIVQWVTLAQLQKDVRCSDNPLRIVNDKLPDTLDTATSYSATIVIDGNYSTPTSNCTVSAPYTGVFIYNASTHTITSTTSKTSGTAVVNCTVNADGRSVSKPFVITINADASAGSGTPPTGNNGNNGNNGNGGNSGNNGKNNK